MSKKACLVVTSVEKYPDGSPTGWYCPELVHPYNVFKKAGFDITIASISGTSVCDPGSLPGDDECQAFMKDEALVALTKNTPKVEDIKAEDFDVVLFAGGFGVMWDYPKSEAAHKLIRDTYTAGKPIGAVCHGPIVFGFVNLADGTSIVAGKEVTGFTNEEENAVGKYETVSEPNGPGSCQDKLGAQGGNFKAGPAWGANVCVAGNLFTGQNPASAGPIAQQMVDALK